MGLILGIDPGTAITGYGLVNFENGKLKAVDYGAIRTEAGMPASDRLSHIYSAVCRLIDETNPDDVAVEELFFNRNAKTALSVGQARGVIILAAAQKVGSVWEYTPLQVKLAVTGNGRAVKSQVGYMVKALLGLSRVPEPDDVADGLAVAICHAHMSAGAARLGLERRNYSGDR